MTVGGSEIFAGIGVGLAIFLLLACELGFWLGRRGAIRAHPKAFDHAMTWQGAVLGLAALLIGFSFAMAVGRFDSRKQILIAEANAIGTTYLRTQLLDDGVGRDLREILRRYVDLRLEIFEAGIDRARTDRLDRATAQLQDQIWSRIVAVGRDDPYAITTGLVLASANEMFDRADDRRASREMPVPPSVFVVLVLVSAIATGAIGYTCGLGGKRMSFGMHILPLLVAGVVMLVFDVAHPSLGIVRVPDAPMIRQRQSM